MLEGSSGQGGIHPKRIELPIQARTGRLDQRHQVDLLQIRQVRDRVIDPKSGSVSYQQPGDLVRRDQMRFAQELVD